MDEEGLLVGVEGVDEDLFGVLHWVIWFWYEADDIVHFPSCPIVVRAHSICSKGMMLNKGLKQLLCLDGNNDPELVRFYGRF